MCVIYTIGSSSETIWLEKYYIYIISVKYIPQNRSTFQLNVFFPWSEYHASRFKSQPFGIQLVLSSSPTNVLTIPRLNTSGTLEKSLERLLLAINKHEFAFLSTCGVQGRRRWNSTAPGRWVEGATCGPSFHIN